MSEQNKDTVRRFWNEVVNDRNMDAIDEMFTTDYEYHGLGGLGCVWKHGPSEVKERIGRYTRDRSFKVDVQDVLAEADKVVSRVAIWGTQPSELLGILPTGRTFETFELVCVYRFVGGKIAEEWQFIDVREMARQFAMLASRRWS